MKIEIKDPNAPDSNFGSLVCAVGYEDVVEFVSRNVPKATAQDSAVVAEIVAAALAVGGYIGAELTAEGLAPPVEERMEFARKWPRPAAALRRIYATADQELSASLEEPKIVRPD